MEGSQLSTPRFTDVLLGCIVNVRKRILEHQFIREMSEGTLEGETFRYFIIQDVLYLREFEKALTILLERSASLPLIHSFANRTLSALSSELTLHCSLLASWSVSNEDLLSTSKSPTCTLYGSYLLATVYDCPASEAFAAFLPCFWSYMDIGRSLSINGSRNKLYQQWIDTYCSPDLTADLDYVIKLVDQVGESASEQEKVNIQRHFHQVSQFEWMFWDAAYRREQWPVH